MIIDDTILHFIKEKAADISFGKITVFINAEHPWTDVIIEDRKRIKDEWRMNHERV